MPEEGLEPPDTRIMIGVEGEDLAYPSGLEVPSDAASDARSPEFGARLGARRRRKRKRRTAPVNPAQAETGEPADTISAMAHAVKAAEADMAKRRAAAEAARGMLGRDPSRSFTDELIAERRTEAAAEDRDDAIRQRRGRG